MKTNVKYLKGPALDWAVAKCLGRSRAYLIPEDFEDYQKEGLMLYSSSWAQGGPIIEKHRINIVTTDDGWAACYDTDEPAFYVDGYTPLVAAMRRIVFRVLGGEVDIPNELEEFA